MEMKGKRKPIPRYDNPIQYKKKKLLPSKSRCSLQLISTPSNTKSLVIHKLAYNFDLYCHLCE